MSSDAEAPGSTNKELERLAIERGRLENEKLRAEVAQGNLAWWKRPAYLGGITPVVLALLGVFSAWATGYFDRERQQLRQEVSTLSERRDALRDFNGVLSQRNEALQASIDDAYLRLKLASASAAYALGHLGAFAVAPEELDGLDLAPVRDALDAQAADILERLIAGARAEGVIAGITADELDALDEVIEAIPASAWARELQPSGPEGVLLSADGTRVYDLESGDFRPRPELRDGSSR